MTEHHSVSSSSSSSSSSQSSAGPSRRPTRFFGQYIVKNHFQFKFALVVFSFLAVATLLMWGQGRWAVNKLIEEGIIQSAQAADQLRVLNNIIFYIGVLALAITFGLSLFFSHFIAGPIFRFEKTFQQMRDGDLTAVVRLRKKDEFQDTAMTFNEALVSLRSKLRGERETVAMFVTRVRKYAEKLKKEGKTEEAAGLEALIADLHNTPPQIRI